MEPVFISKPDVGCKLNFEIRLCESWNFVCASFDRFEARAENYRKFNQFPLQGKKITENFVYEIPNFINEAGIIIVSVSKNDRKLQSPTFKLTAFDKSVHAWGL